MSQAERSRQKIAEMRRRLAEMREEVSKGVDNLAHWNGLISDGQKGLSRALAALHRGDHAEISRLYGIVTRSDTQAVEIPRSTRGFRGLFG